MINPKTARRQMVSQQIRTWDVSNPSVLETIRNIPREHYVPSHFINHAYADVEIPLGQGQCMLRPSIVGRILQSITPKKHETVLEIGTGTGYLTRCLSATASSVMSIDFYENFVTSAREKLVNDNAENVTLDCMDATKNLPKGSFDIVVVTAGITKKDARFTKKLRLGGRLLIFLGKSPNMTATLIVRGPEGTSSIELFETDIPALITEVEEPVFAF